MCDDKEWVIGDWKFVPAPAPIRRVLTDASWFSFFSTLFTSVSICTMGMIAYQRYNSIVRPKDNCLNSIKRAFIAIPGIWVFGLLCAIPPLAAWNMAIFSVDEYSLPVCSVTTVPRGFAYAVYVAIVALFVPFVAMLVFYFLIYWATHRTEFLLSTCLLSALATVCDPLVYVFQNQLFRLCVKNIVLFKGPVNDKAYLRIETAANKTVAGPFTTTTNTSNRRRRYPPGEHPITKGLPPAFTVEEPTELKDETDGKAAGLARADSWGRKGSLPPVDPVKEPELFAEIQRRRWSTRRLSVVILGERIDEDDPTSFDSSCDSFRNDRNGHRALHRISETSNSGVEVPTAPATDKPTRSRRGPRKPHRFSVGVPYFHRHTGGRLNNAEQRPPGYISDFARRCSVGRRPSYEVSIELNVTPFDLKTKEKQMTPNEDSN
ncbi:hypothetical protein Bbelb_062370 [Branchiostoma belcheri]|nr:hypothetical protein Bbelb_062370 [Branchiostoma belcheri]